MRLVAVNRAAELAGLAPGMALADARALVPDVRALEHGPADEAKALAALADWCGRYSPWTAVDGIEAGGAGGVWIDITGAAHLFGGEEALLGDLTARLGRLGYEVRAGLADTPGAAWALARFGIAAGANWRVAAPGTDAQMLAPLPVAGLRLAPEVHAGFVRLGLRTIGDLLPLPRAGLAARFGAEPVRRIDQALGRMGEPIAPRPPASVTRLRLALPEPVGRPEDIEAGAHRLLTAMCQRLERTGRGVRRLELALYRVGGHVDRVKVGTSRASRNPDHLMRLITASLERLPEHAGTEALVDLLVLAVRASAPLAPAQGALDRRVADNGDVEDGAALAALNDRLVSRLGAAAVRQLRVRASHLPERAQMSVPVGGGLPIVTEDTPADRGLRPIRLLAPPQPVEATAPVPDDPPRLFRWQGHLYRVARADGPERLAPEWWRGPTTPGDDDLAESTRDYYRVEDAQGRRFWLYREGLYGAAATPRWFLHGLFG